MIKLVWAEGKPRCVDLESWPSRGVFHASNQRRAGHLLGGNWLGEQIGERLQWLNQR